MARLWSSGAELNSTTALMEITSLSNTPTVVNTTIRSGSFSYRADGGGIDAVVYQPVSGDTNTGTYYIRAYMRIATLPDADVAVLRVLDAGANLSGDIRLTTGGNLQLFQRGNTQVGSNSSALSTGVWYRIELEITPSNAGTGSLRGRLNGTEFAGSASANTDSMHTVRWGKASSATADLYFDDIAINDSSGSFQNSWPGEGSIVHLRPSAAGDNAQWTAGTGSTYAEVDEVTPDDATTVIATTTANDISDFNIDNTPSAIATNDVINCVQVGIRTRISNAATHGVKLRVKAAASGTVEESAEISITGTTWQTNDDAAPRNYQLTLYDLPGSSITPWTKSTLDSAQIGVNHSTDASFNMQVSTLWLLVDYAGSPTVSLSSPADAGSTSDTTPDLTFTGTDPEGLDVRYEVQVDTVNTFSSQALISDNFDDNSLSGQWTESGTGTVAETNQDIEFTTGGSSGNYKYLLSTSTVNLTGKSVYVQLISLGSAASNTDCIPIQAQVDGNNSLFISINAGVIQCYKKVTSTQTQVGSNVTFVGGTHKWFRIREASGTTYWDYSIDGNAWTNITSAANPITVTALNVGMGAGQYGAASATTMIFDNFSSGFSPVVDAVSGTDAGFSGSPDNSDPFASGQAVTYTVQSALSLTTYYWRVRAKDVSGSGQYGAWSSTRSFTVTAAGGAFAYPTQRMRMGMGI